MTARPRPKKPPPSGTIFIPFDAPPSKGTRLAETPSPFGCTLATLQNDDAERNYRYQSFYIRFPDSILEEADDATRQVEFILNHKNVAGRVPFYKGNEGTVRVVNCRIPDAPEALDILYEEIQKFSNQSWVDDQKASQRNTGSGKPGGQTTSEWVQHCTLSLDYTIGNSEGEIFKYVYQITCKSYWVNEQDDGGFGGGGGTWGSGDDGDACEPCQPGDICENTAPGIGCEPGGGGMDDEPISCWDSQVFNIKKLHDGSYFEWNAVLLTPQQESLLIRPIQFQVLKYAIVCAVNLSGTAHIALLFAAPFVIFGFG